MTDTRQFFAELSHFADEASRLLDELQQDFGSKKPLIEKFGQELFTIRGTAQQLGFERIAKLAHLGEELALKARTVENPGQVRKVLATLWDTMTTLKHLLQSSSSSTDEEETILLNRLETMIERLGGKRATVSADEIEALLRNR